MATPGRKLTSSRAIYEVVTGSMFSLFLAVGVIIAAVNGLPETLVVLLPFGWLLYDVWWRTGYQLEVDGDHFIWRSPLRSCAFERGDVRRVRASHWTMFITKVFVVELRNGRRLLLRRSWPLLDWLDWKD